MRKQTCYSFSAGDNENPSSMLTDNGINHLLNAKWEWAQNTEHTFLQHVSQIAPDSEALTLFLRSLQRCELDVFPGLVFYFIPITLSQWRGITSVSGAVLTIARLFSSLAKLSSYCVTFVARGCVCIAHKSCSPWGLRRFHVRDINLGGLVGFAISKAKILWLQVN